MWFSYESIIDKKHGYWKNMVPGDSLVTDNLAA